MKTCVKCGKEIADDSKVCEFCDAPQVEEPIEPKEDPTKTPKYNDDDLNRILKKNRVGIQEENKLLKDKLDKMEKYLEKVDDLYNIIVDDTSNEEEFFEDYEEEVEDIPDDDDEEQFTTSAKKKKKIMDEAVVAARRVEKRKYEKRITSLEDEVNQLRQDAESARNETFQTKKQQALNDAIISAGVKEHLRDKAAKLLRDNIVYDEIDRQWFFRTESGADIDLKDGIINNLEEEFMISYTPGAGSGGKGAVSKEVDALNVLRKNLVKAEEKLKLEPNNDMNRLEVMTLRRQVLDKEKAARESGAIK